MTRIPSILLILLAAGCWAKPDLQSNRASSVDWNLIDANEEQEAIERVQSMDRSAFDTSWKRLGQYSYTEFRVVEIRNDEGVVVGSRKQTLEFAGPAGARGVRIVASDSTGNFEQSFWSRFSESQSDSVAREWPLLVLPDDPLFLSTQGPSYFRYAPLPDTTVGGMTVEVVEAEARQETSRRGIQRARMYIYGDALIGLDVRFLQHSILYQELSDFSIRLLPHAADRWLPKRFKAVSRVGLPFSRTRTYELRAEYTNIRPSS